MQTCPGRDDGKENNAGLPASCLNRREEHGGADRRVYKPPNQTFARGPVAGPQPGFSCAGRMEGRALWADARRISTQTPPFPQRTPTPANGGIWTYAALLIRARAMPAPAGTPPSRAFPRTFCAAYYTPRTPPRRLDLQPSILLPPAKFYSHFHHLCELCLDVPPMDTTALPPLPHAPPKRAFSTHTQKTPFMPDSLLPASPRLRISIAPPSLSDKT